jgi:hypothetical protein
MMTCGKAGFQNDSFVWAVVAVEALQNQFSAYS